MDNKAFLKARIFGFGSVGFVDISGEFREGLDSQTVFAAFMRDCELCDHELCLRGRHEYDPNPPVHMPTYIPSSDSPVGAGYDTALWKVT